MSDLYLRSTDAMSDGRYRCEVSQEAPFTTERAKKDLLVYGKWTSLPAPRCTLGGDLVENDKLRFLDS